ncbi:MAG: PTS sugar transporter subunit IIA [Kiritimatiellae bacterium]|nr:PTS sugar transporter subunit IIA [Kiritimatiellia bacterium]
MTADNRMSERLVLCYSDPSCRAATERLAATVAGMHQAETISLPCPFSGGGMRGKNREAGDSSPFPPAELPGLRAMVADWPDTPEDVQTWLAEANRLHVPAYLLRQSPRATIRRIVVATSNGVHALNVMALAEALGQEWGLPVSFLQIDVHTEDETQARSRRLLDRVLARSFVLGMMVEIGRVPDLARQIDANAGADDLLLIGAPHFGVAASHFVGSLPEQVARIHDGPLAMCFSDPPRSPPLRDFLWDANIVTGTRGLDRDGVVRLLTDRLAASGVLPPDLRDACVARALERETLGSTAVDCQTAIPHALLPRYDGVVAALAICPEGVSFGGGEPSKFVFLLVSSAASHERYLGSLARIASQMLRDEVRNGLLEVQTAEAAMRWLTS